MTTSFKSTPLSKTCQEIPMRKTIQFTLFLTLALLSAGCSESRHRLPSPTDPNPGFAFADASADALPPLNVRPATSLAPDRRTAAVLMDNCELVLDGAGQPMRRSAALQIHVPVSVSEDVHLLGIRQWIRGHVAKSDSASVRIFVDLGGCPFVLDYPPNAVMPEGGAIAQGSFAMIDRAPKREQPEAFFDVRSCDVTILIVLQRRLSTDFARVSIDSIDLVAETQPPRANNPAPAPAR